MSDIAGSCGRRGPEQWLFDSRSGDVGEFGGAGNE